MIRRGDRQADLRLDRGCHLGQPHRGAGDEHRVDLAGRQDSPDAGLDRCRGDGRDDPVIALVERAEHRHLEAARRDVVGNDLVDLGPIGREHGNALRPKCLERRSKALGAKRIAVLTPYRAEVNQIVADYITARGFEVPVFGSFNEGNDRIVAAITPASVKAGIRRILTAGEVDAVFVSCTSVRLAEVAAAIEAEVGLPVTSSNHAMAWHALRLAGIQDGLPQFGKLFTLPIA